MPQTSLGERLRPASAEPELQLPPQLTATEPTVQSAPRWVRNLGRNAGVALAIFIAAHLAQTYLFFDRHESFVWFPSGLSLGLMLRQGTGILPGIFAGLALYYAGIYGLPVWAALWTASTWSVALAVCRNGMLRRGPASPFAAPIHALLAYYVFGVVLAPLLHTLLDLPMMRMAGLLSATDDARSYLFSYWLGESYSALVLGPLFYLWGRDYSRYHTGPTAVYADVDIREKIVWSLIVAMLLGLTYYLGQQHFYAGIQDVELVLYPMLAWSALRLGVIFTNAAVLIVSAAIFTFTAFGLAGTPAPQTQQALIALATFVLTIAVMAQMLAVQDLERRLRNARLAHAASHDWLTDLANIWSFRGALHAQIHISKATQRQFALGYISLHEHQSLEEGYGVKARNELLRRFGRFLAQGLSSDVTVARLTGGNFSVLFTASDLTSATEEMTALHQKCNAFRFTWNAKIYHIAPRFRLMPIDGSIENPDTLMECISGPAVDSEHNGRINVIMRETLDPILRQRRTQVHWLAELQAALTEDRLQLFAQQIRTISPTSADDDTREARMEILVRLLTPAGQIIPPCDFLPPAESYRMLPAIDLWVFTHTCAWFEAHPQALAQTAKISINVSGQSLSDADYRTALREALQTSPVTPQKLCFEITESAAISNIDAAVGFFDQLRAAGASVALDDFGTGMSSFEYLKHFRVDYLKIDGLFVKSLRRQSTDYVIVQAIQNVAQSLGIRTVAEYVESAETHACLRELGVNYAQGYAVGKPLPLAEFFAMRAGESSCRQL